MLTIDEVERKFSKWVRLRKSNVINTHEFWNCVADNILEYKVHVQLYFPTLFSEHGAMMERPILRLIKQFMAMPELECDYETIDWFLNHCYFPPEWQRAWRTACENDQDELFRGFAAWSRQRASRTDGTRENC